MRISPPLKLVLFAQALDNAAALLLGMTILGAGLSLFAGEASVLVAHAGVAFWLGALGVLAFCGIFYRCFFLIFSAATPGCRLMSLRPSLDARDPLCVVNLILECLHLAFPALWLIDAALRTLDLRLGLGYAFSYEQAAHLG